MYFSSYAAKLFFNLKKEAAKVIFFGKTYFSIYGYTNNEFRIFNRNTGSL